MVLGECVVVRRGVDVRDGIRDPEEDMLPESDDVVLAECEGVPVAV